MLRLLSLCSALLSVRKLSGYSPFGAYVDAKMRNTSAGNTQTTSIVTVIAMTIDTAPTLL
jgi:hypothetical protein